MIISIDILFIIIIVMFALLVCFTVYLMRNKRKYTALEQEIDTFLHTNKQAWYHHLINGEALDENLIPHHTHEYMSTERILLTYIQNLSNRDVQTRIRDFSNQYLQTYYRKNLQSRRWSNRMNAMYRIKDFQIVSLVPDCKKLEKSNLSMDESFQLFSIYSLFDQETFLEKLRTTTITFSEYEYKKLLFESKPEIRETLKEYFDDLPIACQYSFIDVLGFTIDINALPFLESQVNHETPEIRIRSLKAIHEIGVVTDIAIFLPFATSEIWEERLMCTKILGDVPLKEALPTLEKLIEDENWWVRSEAARMISKGRFGKEYLEKIMQTSTDKFAVDIATEFLRKGVTIS